MNKWLYLAGLLVAGAVSSPADTIRLKNGTVLEGDITAETETNIVIEISIHEGTIVKTEFVLKADVAEIVRLTPEQKHDSAMGWAFQKLQARSLPANSYTNVAYYDLFISGSLRKFLATYPSSSYEKTVTDQLAEWQAERDKVAAGGVKLDGEWYTKDEIAKQQFRANVQKFVKAGQDAFTAKQWGQAVQAYDALLALHPGGGTEVVANRQLAEALVEWRAELEQQQKKIGPDLAAAQSQHDQAQQALQQAQNALKKSQANVGQSSPDGKLGAAGSEFLRSQQAVANATKEVATTQAQLTPLRAQADKIHKQLADASQRAAPATQTVAMVRDAAPPSTDVLQDTASWWQNNWVLLAGMAVVGVWLLSRFVTR